MKPEYLIKIGNLFVERQYGYSDSMSLTSQQTKAARYEVEELKKVVKWLTLYGVDFRMFNVAGELAEVTAAQLVAPAAVTA